MRTPLVTNGDRISPGTVFLLTVIPAFPNAISASLPLNSLSRKLINIRWLSLPPLTSVQPLSTNTLPSSLIFAFTCLAQLFHSGLRFSKNPAALPAMTCIRGPPCKAGKTALLILFASSSSFVIIKPPLGPRKVLCVVVVTI